MPTPVDYRTIPFHITRLGDSGRYVGRTAYWKLYVVENSFRIVIHSVLRVQIGHNWWQNVADADTLRNVRRVRRNHVANPHHTSPGTHDIYCVFLPDLTKIMRVSSHHFRPIIPDIDQWVFRLDGIRLPRNIAGHMNWLNAADQQLINRLYVDVKGLMRFLSKSVVPIAIP